MPTLRHLIRDYRLLALALLAMSLVFKAAIPVGYMLTVTPEGSLAITICPTTSAPLAQSEAQMQVMHHGQSADGQMAMPMHHQQDADGTQSDHGQKPMHCAFSSLAKLALGGADALLLATALAFILLLAGRPAQRLAFSAPAFLLPPLRGPPASA